MEKLRNSPNMDCHDVTWYAIGSYSYKWARGDAKALFEEAKWQEVVFWFAESRMSGVLETVGRCTGYVLL